MLVSYYKNVRIAWPNNWCRAGIFFVKDVLVDGCLKEHTRIDMVFVAYAIVAAIVACKSLAFAKSLLFVLFYTLLLRYGVSNSRKIAHRCVTCRFGPLFLSRHLVRCSRASSICCDSIFVATKPALDSTNVKRYTHDINCRCRVKHT